MPAQGCAYSFRKPPTFHGERLTVMGNKPTKKMIRNMSIFDLQEAVAVEPTHGLLPASFVQGFHLDELDTRSGVGSLKSRKMVTRHLFLDRDVLVDRCCGIPVRVERRRQLRAPNALLFWSRNMNAELI